LPPNPDGHSLKFRPTATTKGYLHTHLSRTTTFKREADGSLTRKQESPIHIFSPEDVGTFLLILRAAHNAGEPLTDKYAALVSPSGNYILRFNGNYADINFGINLDGLKIAYEDEFKNVFGKNKRVRKFLQFVENEMGTTGLQLFEEQNDGSYAEKTLRPDGRRLADDAPCA